MAHPVYFPRKTQWALLSFVAAHFWPISPEIRRDVQALALAVPVPQACMAMAVTEPFFALHGACHRVAHLVDETSPHRATPITAHCQ
jgi:hypothetical protein